MGGLCWVSRGGLLRGCWDGDQEECCQGCGEGVQERGVDFGGGGFHLLFSCEPFFYEIEPAFYLRFLGAGGGRRLWGRSKVTCERTQSHFRVAVKLILASSRAAIASVRVTLGK